MRLNDEPADGDTFPAGETVSSSGDVAFDVPVENVTAQLDGISGNRHPISAAAFAGGSTGEALATGVTWLADTPNDAGQFPFRGELQLPTRPGRYVVRVSYSEMRGRIAAETPGQMAVIDGLTIEVR